MRIRPKYLSEVFEPGHPPESECWKAAVSKGGRDKNAGNHENYGNYPLSIGVFQRPLTRILLQKHRDTNRSHIVIQIGGVYTTFCQEEGILLQRYRDRNGRCIAILFKSTGVRDQFDSPDSKQGKFQCYWGTTRTTKRTTRCNFRSLPLINMNPFRHLDRITPRHPQ